MLWLEGVNWAASELRVAVAELGDTHQRPRAADNRQQTRVPWPLSTPESAMSWWQLESSLNGSVIGCANDWCVIDACSERKRCVFAACAVTPRHCTTIKEPGRSLSIISFVSLYNSFFLSTFFASLALPPGLLSRFPLLPSATVFSVFSYCHDYIGSHAIDSLDVVVLFSWVVLSLPLFSFVMELLVLFSFATAFMICRGYYSLL